MSVLNTNRNIRTVLLGNSLIQGFSRYTKDIKFVSWEGHIKLWYTGRQSQKLMASGKSRISSCYQENSYSMWYQ